MSATDDLIISAVNQGLLLYQQENLTKLVEAVLPTVGSQLRSAVRVQDAANQTLVLYSQALDRKGKWQPGALLAAPGRAVITWSEGVLRPQGQSKEVSLREGPPFEDQGQIPSGRFAIKMRRLRLAGAHGPVEVGVPDVGRSTLAIETLAMLLVGAVTFD